MSTEIDLARLGGRLTASGYDTADTTPAPPLPEELAYHRRLAAVPPNGNYTIATAKDDCATQFNGWAARKSMRDDAVGSHFRKLAVVTRSEVTHLVDGGLYYAFIDRGGIDDVTADTGEDSELEAYARFGAYLETDGAGGGR